MQDVSEELPDSIRGSAVWREDESVIGFVEHFVRTGVLKDWCSVIGADVLVDEGYTLVEPAADDLGVFGYIRSTVRAVFGL